MGNAAFTIGSPTKRARNLWSKKDGVWQRERRMLVAYGNADNNFVEPTAGLAARYSFEGNLVDSVNGYNLTGVGSLGYGPGVVGNAVQYLAGSSSSRITSATLGGYFYGNHAYSISLWANVPTATEIFKQSSGETASSNPSIFLRDTYVTLRREIRAGGTGDVTDITNVVGPPIVFNKWHHIAATYDGSTLSLYVDGEKTTAASTFSVPDYGIIFFKLTGTVYPDGFGLIDQARVYNRSLTDAEVQALFSERSSWKRVNL